MAKKLTTSDVLDVNSKTGALILGKNRLEDYATKYLNIHCKEALETPMPLPVDKILREAGLVVKEVSLSPNLDIFGCCLLLDGEVQIYDFEKKEYQSIFYNAGTVLVDPASEALRGIGAKRNTLMHEALHWEKDKKYFEILALKNSVLSEKLYPIMCRQSERFYDPPEGKKTKENEVCWLEWQAHRLAPRVLMPYNSFKKKALEIIDYQKKCGHEISCDVLIEELSEFFIVSRSSVKYRLLEVGLKELISVFDDYDSIYADINNSKDFIQLTYPEAYQMLDSDSSLLKWVNSGHYLFVDGYFVLNNEKYIIFKDGQLHLSSIARKNLSHCVINIREHRVKGYSNLVKDFDVSCYLFQIEKTDTRILCFLPEAQKQLERGDYDIDKAYRAVANNILSSDDEQCENEIRKMVNDSNTTLCQCLWFLMKDRFKYPDGFSEKTLLNKNYHGKIKNDKYNNMGKEVLLAVCIGLGLNLTIIRLLFDKSNNKLDYFKKPDKIYIKILERFPGISITEFNRILESMEIKQLGSEIR